MCFGSNVTFIDSSIILPSVRTLVTDGSGGKGHVVTIIEVGLVLVKTPLNVSTYRM